MRTKTCDNGHQEITFSYISEIEECPVCTIIEEHGEEIDEINNEHEEESSKLYERYEKTTTRITEAYEEEIKNLKSVIQISHQEISRLERRLSWNV